MKVFTVGLDQKQPIEKSESPPPGYVSSAATPLPMGPEIAPIIVRKSRGYKGILMIMLGVFLMAIFALTLSEMAYNRQRDENFFRLQWAQLKHRLGYDYDLGNRIIPVNRGAADFAEIAALSQQKQDSAGTTTTTESAPKIFIEPSSSQDSSSSASAEQQNPMENFVRDARLQFLRQILQRIKQNAEEMGFDGTMQVSVIEVEPQNMGEFGAGKKPSNPSEDPRSDAFLDSFGEFHAPSPFGPQGGPPPMREINENSIVPQAGAGRGGRNWPEQPMPSDFSGFEVPMPPFPQQQQMNFRPDMMMGFRAPHEWSMDDHWRRPEGFEIHPKSGEFSGPSVGGSPSQEIMGEIYGRKFGRMLQDLIAARIQNSLMQQQQAAQQPAQMMMPNLIMPMRPSFPIESVPQQQQPSMPQGWWEPQATGQQQQSQQLQFPPPPPPPTVQQQASQPSTNQQSAQQASQVPTGQQQAQAPQMPQPSEQFGQNFPQPQFPVFISPEDRIQIEPPNAMWQQQAQQQQQPGSDEKPQVPHAILDFMPPPRAWTHQSESAPSPSPASASSLVDGEVQPQPQTDDQSSTNNPEMQSNRIVILKKQPQVDGEKHEELGSSQLADLPLKELQGQLAAAAAAALAAQQQQDIQEQQRFNEEARLKNNGEDLQRPMQQEQPDLFKSLEQPQTQEHPTQPQMMSMPETVAEEHDSRVQQKQQQQQPVEPAPLMSEQQQQGGPQNNNEETSEQVVDFPAVKFPQMAASDAVGTPMNDLPDQQGGIFFQVDEPQHNSQARQQEPAHNMAGFV